MNYKKGGAVEVFKLEFTIAPFTLGEQHSAVIGYVGERDKLIMFFKRISYDFQLSR